LPPILANWPGGWGAERFVGWISCADPRLSTSLRGANATKQSTLCSLRRPWIASLPLAMTMEAAVLSRWVSLRSTQPAGYAISSRRASFPSAALATVYATTHTNGCQDSVKCEMSHTRSQAGLPCWTELMGRGSSHQDAIPTERGALASKVQQWRPLCRRQL
jgi:hypothetical protein